MAHSGLELITNNAAPPLKFYKMPRLPSLPKRSEHSCMQVGERGISLDWLLAPFHWNQRRVIVTYDICCQYRHPVTQRLLEDERAIQSP
ncbi:hypothetical protein B0H13DRAFT_2335452 [Mycena leptocephala]|nr:hypothetical protein B0H13DRAFT_2335452 [Mycena leptocephala]